MNNFKYPLDDAILQSVHAKLIYITHSKDVRNSPSQSQPHTHAFTEICYMKSGNGKYIIDDQTCIINENDFIIISPNVSHTELSAGEVTPEFILVGIEGLDFSLKINSQYMLFSNAPGHTDLWFYLNILHHEMEMRQPNYELICQNLLEIVIALLFRNAPSSFQEASYIKAERECTRLKHYMDSCYAQNISLDTLAQLSHLNKYYMVHTFTRQFGCSPISYLCEVRINASKELLTTTDYSITEIAQASGFSSQSYFAQCFQKNCGMTASSYRKKYRK